MGACAVISGAVYGMLYLGAANEYAVLLISGSRLPSVVLYGMPVLFFVTERVFSGLSVVWFKPAKKEGLAAGFARTAKKKADRLALLLWLAGCAVLAGAACLLGLREAGYTAAAMGLVQLLVFGWYHRMSMKEFGGMTGDLAGCFLQVCELASFWTLVILFKTAGGYV